MSTTRAQKQEQMFALIEQYLHSQQTQPEFCRSATIPLSTFQFWLKKYRQTKPPQQSQSQGPVPGFVPLTFSHQTRVSTPSQPGCTIHYPNGVLVEFNGPVDTKILLELVLMRPGHAF
jgi:hypothetical protein